MKNKLLHWSATLTVAVALSVGIGYLFAWSGPPYNSVCSDPPCPPGGNAPAPINVGSIDQTKTGDVCTTAPNGTGSEKCLSTRSGGINFITPVNAASGSNTANSGAKVDVTYNASGDITAPNVVAVILETSVQSRISPPTAISIRKNASSPYYTANSVLAQGSEDNITVTGQGIFPINSDKTFQYSVAVPSSGAYFWSIKIVGYMY